MKNVSLTNKESFIYKINGGTTIDNHTSHNVWINVYYSIWSNVKNDTGEIKIDVT